jgi:hypothetical protein
MDYKIRATWWSGTCYHKEQLEKIIANTDVKNYAHILHDKDKNDDGTPKKPHYHFLIQLQQKQRGSWFKAFGSDDMGIVFAEPCFAPLGAFNYLTHDTPHAIKQGKFLYDPCERVSTIDNFESDDKLDETAELWADLIEVLEMRMSWFDFIQKKPKRLHMISNIHRAYGVLYFEKYGRPFYDISRPQRHEMRPHANHKIDRSTGELTPITDKKIIDDMPF